ncbi:glutarate dioxygenase GlaH [Achromobacter ruhlandii]|jgi:protein CsiD|uniref:glutarate dioxygenase GlaH n=1 Tax=Achromobacter TaxID=222 RepID=UPI0014669ACC|nr:MULTISPECIES: glutarate dioxygenase GlaH [Achromobacter]MCV6796807.1 glutarate dioxygenase GlaH [Achromobacter ruhlandii]MCV6800970.1 glutarate dioxygenase GlaH [Achromobacter ruhlandii]MCV6809871.1 glutarate dioxygenase GlaH [Achromobacter ruhlandii]MCV6819116.1 glutarate dioxygenase GlaH [Achromobacter ruhlandii]CAB3874100.1 Glutarate 2-hydroxylase [Achromobacter mucicolens]
MNDVSDAQGLSSGAVKVAPHETHSRVRKVTVRPEALLHFLAEVKDIEVQNLEYVPFMRFKVAEALMKACGDELRGTLTSIVEDRDHGGFTIGLQGVSTDPDDFVKFGTAIAYLLGPANHDSMSGKYYARFMVKHTDNSDSYLRQAYRLFTMHTDGTYVSEATDWLLMMKFSEHDAVGGESRFLHLDDWEHIGNFLQHPLATKPLLYKSPASKNVAEQVERPLFFQNRYGLAICFIDQFLQPATLEEALYVHDLSASIEISSGVQEITLPPGELVVLNNYFYLHGRAPFQKSESLHRELMRIRGLFGR